MNNPSRKYPEIALLMAKEWAAGRILYDLDDEGDDEDGME